MLVVSVLAGLSAAVPFALVPESHDANAFGDAGPGPGPNILGGEFVINAGAAENRRTLDASWHPGTGQFLVAWGEYPDADLDGLPDGGDGDLRGQVVNLDSSLAGGDFLIAGGGGIKEFPQIAAVGDTLQPSGMLSLVVWMDDRDGGYDVWGQLLGPAGNALSGANFKISGADEDLFPALTYGQTASGQGVFLVAWQRETGADASEVFARVVQGAGGGGAGTLVGSSFQVSETSGAVAELGIGSDVPGVGYDPVNDQFLVVWADERGGDSEEDNVWGQFVSAGGALVGANFQISSQADEEYAPQAVYHPQAAEYLVVWNRHTSVFAASDVHAQRVSSAGALLGGVISVAATGDTEEAGDVAIDADSGSYVVPLNTGPIPGDRIKVEIQKVNVAGALVGARAQVATDAAANKGPIAAAFGSTIVGPGAGVASVSEVLFAWRDFRSATGYDVYGRMAEVVADTDGDGLLDPWETGLYVDNNDNGVLDAGDLDFSTFPVANQPNVNRKDLYIETDWMQVDADTDGVFCDAAGNGCDPTNAGDHTHGPLAVAASVPTGTSLDAVVTSFANAPVANPDGTTGITLHIDVGQLGGGGPITETVGVDFFAGFEAVKAANFAANRARAFHYGVFKHEGSGRGEIWGNDFWMGSQYNTQVLQGADLMHEFGHNLALRHGGGVNTPTCQPNYMSIMSYTFSTTGVPPTFRLDYSSQDLADLNEASLNEGTALGDGIDHTGDAIDQTIYSMGAAIIGPSAATAASGGIDWDNDGTLGESGAAVGNNNINNIPAIGGFLACGSSPINEVMTGFDDWANLRYSFRNSPNFDDNVHALPDEVDVPVDAWRDHYGEPSLSLSKAGTAEGLPGDSVTYTILVANGGPGPARNVDVTDAWPAGLTFTGSVPGPVSNALNGDGSRSLLFRFDGALLSGASVSVTLNGVIDFPPIGDTVTNGVSLSGQNVLGEVQPPLAAAFVTDIRFPDLEVTKTVTPSVNAGEPIAIDITYENVGDADAEDVVVADTLTAEVAYVAGSAIPPPTSVTLNGDGTTTIEWSVGTVAPGGGGTITVTARPSLLLVAPDVLVNLAPVAFEDANDNVYPAEVAVAATVLTEVTATEDVRPLGWWKNHEGRITEEIRAMIQATDTRYDLDGNGVLSEEEAHAALQGDRPQDRISHLRSQLFATYLNLATRAYNAGTAIPDSLDGKIAMLGLDFANIREAAWFARDVLAMPLDAGTDYLYVKAFTALAEVNTQWAFARG
ncbi:MAG TPA: hypothetical protein VGR51_00435 [Thermoplasmata archaeon]|nr:hypothetical protein [Thermoplasmata archaeon]